MEVNMFCPMFAPAAKAGMLRLGWPGVNTRKKPMATARGTRCCRGHDADNQDGSGVLLAGTGPAWLAETSAAPASRGDGADLRANTCRARCRENKGDMGWRERGSAGHPASLSPTTVCSKIKSEPARCESPRKAGPGWSGDSPLPTMGLLGTVTEGRRLKSRQIAGMIYDSLFFGARVG